MDSQRQKGMERNMKNFEVGHLPTVIYIPDFITESEETHLRDKIYEAPLSKWKSLKNRRLQNWGGAVLEKGLLPQDLPPWLMKITQRVYEESRLFPSAINHVLINEYCPNQGIMPHQDGPAYFPVVAILSLGSPVVMDFTPHSRLKTCTNSWCNREERTLDGESVDTNGASDMIENHRPFSVLLMPRSLLIFKDIAYSDYLHGITNNEVQPYDEVVNEAIAMMPDKADQSFLSLGKAVEVNDSKGFKVIHRTTNRISLTCRLVIKVHKNLFKF